MGCQFLHFAKVKLFAETVIKWVISPTGMCIGYVIPQYDPHTELIRLFLIVKGQSPVMTSCAVRLIRLRVLTGPSCPRECGILC